MRPPNEFQIAHKEFWYQIEESHKTGGGVYVLFSKENGVRKPIPRLLEIDSEGKLYIGKADSFLDRVIMLKKSLSPDHISTGHECGVRWKIHKKIQERFPYESLHVALYPTDDPRGLESTMLKKYEKQFGELPPLNRVQ